MSFDPIVASGLNAAHPHARPTDRTLREGELVVIDMGGITNGYASDMTRTVALGEPKPAAQEGYEAVLRAQKAALGAARAGMTGEELDAVARSVLDEAGLESFFTHGLGHGIGLQVHEWPRVSRTSDAELPEGACVTIEPGVYVPDESYGVRIEDIVVLRNGGSENLTRSPKDLLVL
jgi:Xaa-Pro aminopeptidase